MAAKIVRDRVVVAGLFLSVVINPKPTVCILAYTFFYAYLCRFRIFLCQRLHGAVVDIV